MFEQNLVKQLININANFCYRYVQINEEPRYLARETATCLRKTDGPLTTLEILETGGSGLLFTGIREFSYVFSDSDLSAPSL